MTLTQAEYEKAKAQYDRDKQAYDQAIARLGDNLGKNGWISKAVGQGLIFENEPNAVLKVTASRIKPDGNADVTVSLSEGQTAIATYTGLSNSTYGGEKIAKVVYTYTARNTAGNELIIFKDPTKTVRFKNKAPAGKGVSSRISMKVEFFREDGSKISFNEKYPAIIAFNSLNRSKAYAGSGSGESVRALSSNIEFVPITGSEVGINNGTISSRVYNDYKINGSRFNANGLSTNPLYGDSNYWDGEDRPNRWYGAGAGVVRSGDTISFDIINSSYIDAPLPSQGDYWFAFNSKVASTELPKVPVEPKAPAKVDTPPPPPPPPAPVVEEKPVMECIDCSCEQLQTGWDACAGLHDMNDTKLAGAAKVIADTPFCDYPKVLPKILYGIWCLMKNNLAQLCWMLAQLEKVYKALEKLLQNLKKSGAWVQTGPTIFDGDLAPDRSIATGNINLFGGTPDGPHFIRTNSGSTEDDLAGGI